MPHRRRGRDAYSFRPSIAELDAAGRLKIIDRIKNVVKLSQGYGLH